MAIVPTENGCKLYMHSVDRPGGSIPSKIINWAAKNGIPSYLDVVNKACDDFVSSKWIDDAISLIEAFPKFTFISSSAFRWLQVSRKTEFHITLLTLKIFWKYLLLWPTRCPKAVQYCVLFKSAFIASIALGRYIITVIRIKNSLSMRVLFSFNEIKLTTVHAYNSDF